MYIIDNSNFCYKFKSVHTYAQTSVNGVSVDVSVLAGYIKSLRINPFTDIYIVLDGVPFESINLLPGYKGQRHKEAEDKVSVPKLEVAQFLSKVGTLLGKNIQLVCAPGQEADQVISSMVHMATGKLPDRYKFTSKLREFPLQDDRCLSYLVKGNPTISELSLPQDTVVVGTTDSDMQQLCKFPGVIIDNSTSGRNIRTDTAVAVHGLPPAAIPIYKAICGDQSDNVPAIDKVSPEKVARMLRSLKTLEDAQAFVVSVTSGQIVKGLEEISLLIRDHKAEFRRNYDVVNLRFFSIPKRIEFPGYDINATIEKYRLRV